MHLLQLDRARKTKVFCELWAELSPVLELDLGTVITIFNRMSGNKQDTRRELVRSRYTYRRYELNMLNDEALRDLTTGYTDYSVAPGLFNRELAMQALEAFHVIEPEYF